MVVRNETMAVRPASAVGRRRPVCEYAQKAAMLSGSFRFKVIVNHSFYLLTYKFTESLFNFYITLRGYCYQSGVINGWSCIL